MLPRYGRSARVICKVLETYHVIRRGFKFLPSSYRLDEQWQNRLSAPLMQQIRVEEFFVELKKKFDADKSGSPLDVEIFMNRIDRAENLKQVTEILSSFRVSKNLTVTRPSVNHAVARHYLTFDIPEDLLPMLWDKTRFGLFLDHFSGNLLSDKFLSIGNTPGAVRVAVEFMLQESFENPITRDLALYSCLSFLKEPNWEAIAPPPPPAPVDTGEEVIVYIDFVRNPWFDDHFDMRDPKHLVGKTLYVAGLRRDDLLGRSSQLLGLSLYQKWPKALRFLQELLNRQEAPILRSSVDAFLEVLKAAPKPQPKNVTNPDDIPPYPRTPLEEPEDVDPEPLIAQAEDLISQLNSRGLVKDGDILQLAEESLRKTVAEVAPEEAENQLKLYEKWEAARQEEVSLQIHRYELEERLKALSERRKKLQQEEDFLFFFERKSSWEKMLTPEARQKMLDEQAQDGSYYDYRVQDPGYEIPQIKPPQRYIRVPAWEKDQVKYDENRALMNAKK